MKIVHVIFTIQYGGAETLLIDIANKQVEDNDVTIVVINDEVSKRLLATIDSRVKIICFNRKRKSWNVYLWVKIVFDFMKLNPDIIHSHDSKAIFFIPYPFFKTILTVHAVNLSLTGVRKYSKIVAVSNAVKDDLFRRGSINSKLILNGVDLKKILVRQQLSSDIVFKILQVSRLQHEVKGQHILLEAMSILRKKNLSLKISLDLIGDGESYSYLNELVNSFGISDCVRFLGKRDREYIYTHLCDYDLLVQPSLYEGFGLTIIEAMGAGIPVLVSDIWGPVEIIKHGEYGYFFQSANVEDCATQILKIIEASDQKQEIVDKALVYSHKNFDLKYVIEEYDKLYNCILNCS